MSGKTKLPLTLDGGLFGAAGGAASNQNAGIGLGTPDLRRTQPEIPGGKGEGTAEKGGGKDPTTAQTTRLFGALRSFADALGLDKGKPSPAARLQEVRREKISSVLIEASLAEDILEPLISAMSIGRSGFARIAEGYRYASFVGEFYKALVFEIRNRGYRPEVLLGFLSSATAGIIDEISRTLGRSLGGKAVTFMDTYLENYIDPEDQTLEKVVHLGDENYSKGSLAFSDIVFSFSGGAYALYNDIPEAVKKIKAFGKGRIYLINFSGLPPFEKDVVTGNPFRIANNVKLLMDEYKELCQLIERRLKNKYKKKYSVEEFMDPDFEHADYVEGIFRRRNKRLLKETDGNRPLYSYVLFENINRDEKVLKNPQELWQYMKFVGGEYRPIDAISELVDDLLVSFPEKFKRAKSTPVSSGNYFPDNHKNGLQVAVTGRQLHVNYADSRREMEAIFKVLGEALYLSGRDHNLGVNDMGFVHGLQDGFDQLFLDAIASSGYPSYGILNRGDEKGLQNAESYGFNLFAEVGGNEEALIKAILGYDYKTKSYNSDVLVAFEGDSLSQKLIERAHKNNIPVIVVQASSPKVLLTDIQNSITGEILRQQIVSVLLYLYKSERDHALVGKKEDLSDGLIGQIIESRPDGLSFNLEAGVLPGLVDAKMAGERMLASLESYADPDKDLIHEVSQFTGMVSLALTMMQSNIDLEAEQEKPENERMIFVVKNGGELAETLASIKGRKG